MKRDANLDRKTNKQEREDLLKLLMAFFNGTATIHHTQASRVTRSRRLPKAAWSVENGRRPNHSLRPFRRFPTIPSRASPKHPALVHASSMYKSYQTRDDAVSCVYTRVLCRQSRHRQPQAHV